MGGGAGPVRGPIVGLLALGIGLRRVWAGQLWAQGSLVGLGPCGSGRSWAHPVPENHPASGRDSLTELSGPAGERPVSDPGSQAGAI